MDNIETAQKEARYGIPAADLILFNRFYIIGYSYYFRQPKWVLEIVHPPTINAEKEGVPRADNFRSDLRVPEMFRADKVDFQGSGYDRGHMVPSADLDKVKIQNSETFLLSNMSPQQPAFNRFLWRRLENKVRVLNNKEEILETYVVTGPIFDFQKIVNTIGNEDSNEVTIPVPHAYFKSILTEDDKGNFKMWSFILDNENSDSPLSDFRVPTSKVERWAGIQLWDRLTGAEIQREKKRVRSMW